MIPVIDSTFIAVVAGSFAASVANAMFSAGGALIVLAVTSTVLPIQAIVPIHSTLLIGSTATRIVFFWQFIDWKIVWPFIAGSLVGAVVGVQPFGGQGLSGTGPKAGGPHYLHRFATEKTLTINTSAVRRSGMLSAPSRPGSLSIPGTST